jgi:hypothetical protein
VEYDSRIFPPDQLPDEISHYALYNFFNFESEDKRNETKNKKLQLINRHIKEHTHTNDHIENIRFLNHLETKLGIPPMGTNRLEHIYRWCKISSQIQDLENERERLRQ